MWTVDGLPADIPPLRVPLLPSYSLMWLLLGERRVYLGDPEPCNAHGSVRSRNASRGAHQSRKRVEPPNVCVLDLKS